MYGGKGLKQWATSFLPALTAISLSGKNDGGHVAFFGESLAFTFAWIEMEKLQGGAGKLARPRKKPEYDPEQIMEEFMGAVADAFGFYDDRSPGRNASSGLNAVAAEFGITALKARKLLITAGVYSTALSR